MSRALRRWCERAANRIIMKHAQQSTLALSFLARARARGTLSTLCHARFALNNWRLVQLHKTVAMASAVHPDGSSAAAERKGGAYPAHCTVFLKSAVTISVWLRVCVQRVRVTRAC